MQLGLSLSTGLKVNFQMGDSFLISPYAGVKLMYQNSEDSLEFGISIGIKR